MSEHSAHLTSLPFGFRTWLWRYIWLLLLISMLWHRHAMFERRQVVFLCWMQDSNLEVSRHLFSSRLNAHSQTDWAIEGQAKKNLEFNSPSLWCLNQNVGSVIFIMIAFCHQWFEIILLIRNLLYHSQIWNPCTYNKIMKSGVILSIIYTSGQLYGIAHMLAAWVHI